MLTNQQHEMIVVNDVDFEASAQKLFAHGFTTTKPNRAPPPEVLADLDNPDHVVARIYAAWAPLDDAARIFAYPETDNKQLVFLLPNSFACLPLDSKGRTEGHLSHEVDFISNGNIYHPLERALVESFVKCALLLENTEQTRWGASLMVSVWVMIRYLDIENDILDTCTDTKAVEFFSKHFGREHDAEFGPKDLRIQKRLGSGREMPIDSRGRRLP